MAARAGPLLISAQPKTSRQAARIRLFSVPMPGFGVMMLVAGWGFRLKSTRWNQTSRFIHLFAYGSAFR